MKKQHIIWLSAFLLLPALGLALSGCIKFDDLKHANQAITYYTLSYPPPPVTQTSDAAVRLRRFQAASIYKTDRLVIQQDAYTTEYDYYHRWRVNPATLITDLLLRDMSASNIFKAILINPGHLLPDYELSGTIEAFRAYKGDRGWEVELALNILFYPVPNDKNQADSEKIFQKRYQTTLPCNNDSPVSIVNALNICMQKTSNSIQEDLAAYLANLKGAPGDS